MTLRAAIMPLWPALVETRGLWAAMAITGGIYAGMHHFADAGKMVCTPIDGDTLDCDGTRYRLWGLHAPERDEDGGQAATDALAAIVAHGASCEPTGDVSWGREVAVCTTEAGDIAALMVAAGVGRDCARFSGGRYAEFETAESRALPLPDYCLPPSHGTPEGR